MSYPASLDNIASVTTGQLIASSYVNSQTTAINNIESALGLNPMRGLSEGRLTFSTGVAVPTSDVTGSSAQTLYFTPFHGNRIALFDGTNWNIRYLSSDLSLALTGLSTSSIYDVFCYDNSGTPTLEFGAAWTNATTRSAALALQDGVLVKSGSTTRRYLGTIRTTSNASPIQGEDSAARRFVFNAQNRVPRNLAVSESTSSWNYSSTTFRQANSSASNKVEVVVGMTAAEEPIQLTVHHSAINTAGGEVVGAGVGVDSTSTNSADVFGAYIAAANQSTAIMAMYRGMPGIGYHALNWLEAGGSSGTTTFYGSPASTMKTGMSGSIMA